MVSFKDALAASVEYFGGDEMAADVFIKKYALRDENHELLEMTPDDMHRRLAREFARIEAKYPNPMSEDEIFELLRDFRYIVPQGSPMSGIGNDYSIQSLSNCFVIKSPHDSYAGILTTDQEQVQIMKRRGGVGFDISTIRPAGLITSNASRTTDGIAVFMQRFSNSCREVAQGGRRGALMLTLDIRHPDVETFIDIKKDLTKITGANISLRISDEFMNAVESDSDFTLQWPVDAAEPTYARTVKARQIWDKIIDSAWSAAEPGVLFWDTVKRETPADIYSDEGFGSVSTNPCLTAETLVSVADGRGLVPIKQLADEGVDVPVYALGFDGKTVIKTMRNPRITGFNVPVYRVNIEGGHSFKATANHKVLLKDGSYVEIDKLKCGDALHVSWRVQASFNEIRNKSNSRSQDYVWMCNDSLLNIQPEHRMIWEFNNGTIPKGHVIHHKDFKGMNNNITNLDCMSKLEHHELHAAHMRGSMNPMHKVLADPEKSAKWKLKRSNLMTVSNPISALIKKGDMNAIESWAIAISSAKTNIDVEFYDISLIKEHIRQQTKVLGRRLSMNDWKVMHNPFPFSIPQTLLINAGYATFHDLLRSIAEEECVMYHDAHPNTLEAFIKIKQQGYDVFIKNDRTYVRLKCKHCNVLFERTSDRREVSYCSVSCLAHARHMRDDVWKNAIKASNKSAREATARSQLDVFLMIPDASRRQWENECKKQGISYKLGGNAKFRNFKELKEHATFRNHQVVSVEFVGNENVFNGTVDDVHNFYFGGWEETNSKFAKPVQLLLNNKQCGEIVLSPYDSCRLLVVNALSYVRNAFTEDATFDLKLFNEHAVKAQRLMDDLIDIEIEHIDAIIKKVESDPEPDDIKAIETALWQKIRDACVKGRRTGLGLTGVGDTLAYLNIRYGSKESILMIEELYRSLAVAANKSSVQLAVERGAFPICDVSRMVKHQFISRLLDASDAETRAAFMKYGRRNICLTTTAPAGSVSLMTRTTSGIEPAYMLQYVRRRKLTQNDVGIRVDFEDSMGDKWQEYDVFHPGFKHWRDVSGLTDVKSSPYHMSTSNDVDWVASVDVQAVAQRWIEHSLSKTCNLPASTTRDVVAQVYMRAWKTGCKGFTVYRDGCRAGVLVSAKTNDVAATTKTTRPKELPCEIHHANIKGEAWTILVGMIDEKPYEIFGGLSRFVEIPKKYDRGLIIKNERKTMAATYDLRICNGSDITIKDIVEQFDNPNHSVMTRMISLALRQGAPIQQVVEQLQKGDRDSDMFSFAKVLSRVLKGYIVDGAETDIVKKCDSCGGTKFHYSEGCVSCSSCGWSRC